LTNKLVLLKSHTVSSSPISSDRQRIGNGGNIGTHKKGIGGLNART